jgi:hypothetical protein
VFVLVEIIKIGFIRYPLELSRAVVCPTVKIAGQIAAARASAVGDQLVAAMRADVVEGTDFFVPAPHHQYRSVANRELANEVVARPRDLPNRADIEP